MKITIHRKNDSRESFSSLPFSELIEHIRGGKYRVPVLSLRNGLLHAPPFDGFPIVLKNVPRIIIPAVLRKKDTILALSKYNGVVLLTLKGFIDQREAAKVRNEVSMVPQTLAAFVGASGKTVKVLVAFTLPDGSLPQTEEQVELFHAHAFRWAVAFYSGQFPNYTIRSEKPGYRQSCRYSYDPDCYYTPSPFPIRMKQPTEMPGEVTYREQVEQEKDPLKRLLPGIERMHILGQLYESCQDAALVKTCWKEDQDDPKEVLVTLAENCFRSGIEEETVTRYAIRDFWKVPHVLIRQMIHNVYQRKKGFGTAPCISPAQLLSLRTEEFMNRRYKFRYNTQKGSNEYMERNGLFYQFMPLTDRVMNSIALEAMREGINLWDKDVKRWVNSNKVPLYAPVEDYLFYLPRWDGRDRIREMAGRVPCNNPRWPDFFYRWFLSMVAHWSRKIANYANATSPMLVGGQGTGKSTFCRQLTPPELREYYTDHIDFSRKRDAEIFLNRFALINIDELDQITSSQQGFLKHILQKPVVNVRKPNQSAVTELRRYASFIATSNHPDLLTDTSGSRRFIGITVTGRIDNRTRINYEQLYAQAMYALQKNEQYWFTPQEEAELTESNREFEKPDMLEQLFLHYYQKAEEGEEKCLKLTTYEILTFIRTKSKITLPPGKLTYFGRILKKLNINNKRVTRGRLYFVKERDHSDVE